MILNYILNFVDIRKYIFGFTSECFTLSDKAFVAFLCVWIEFLY